MPPNHVNPDKITLHHLQSLFQMDEALTIGHIEMKLRALPVGEYLKGKKKQAVGC